MDNVGTKANEYSPVTNQFKLKMRFLTIKEMFLEQFSHENCGNKKPLTAFRVKLDQFIGRIKVMMLPAMMGNLD